MTSWTLQGLIDARMTVTAHCHNPRCHHSQRLDLEALKERFGPDAPAMADDLVPKLSCRACGGQKGKAIGLTYSPPGNDARAPNAYQRAKDGR